MSAKEACHEAARLYVLSGYSAALLATFYGFDDEYGSMGRSGLSYVGRTVEEIDEDVRRSAREILDQAA